MKRISLVLVVLALSPAVTQAYYGYGCCCGVHYTPYALSYRHSGLVNGCVEYTPYALSYRNTGLVEGYGVCTENFGFAVPAVGVRRGLARRSGGHAARISFRRFAAADPQPAPSRPAPDGLITIRKYLGDRGFANASINHILRIDNKLVGVDFTLPEQKLVIRYWDPKEVEKLSAQPAGVQMLYGKHKQAWETYAEQNRQLGAEIYCVEASDPQTIVASLQACPRLDTGNDSLDRPVMYAKK
jgi:hypothetical protein